MVFYTLGPIRKSLNDDQKSEYSKLFEEYFLKSFSSRLAEYTNPEINVYNKEKILKLLKSKKNIDSWWNSRSNIKNREIFLKKFAKSFSYKDFDKLKKLV